ncbi:MAG: tetratricopeptide repeat protein [Kofleriaceae bacterium]
MIELYSMKDVARIFAVQEARLRYWMQVGFVGPTVRKGGRFYYTFRDLVGVKAAKDLLAAGVPLAAVRRNLEALKKTLPDGAAATSNLRICSDGETLVALEGDVPFEPTTGQVVMAFTVPTLAGRVAEVMALPTAEPAPSATAAAPADDAAPAAAIDPETTDANPATTAYRLFLDGCLAEDRADLTAAEHLYRHALELEPNLAAAHTNLGNLLHQAGDHAGARAAYEHALELEPTQAEARYNLANVLEDEGELELAIAELRRVCAVAPDFADAHYNLGLLLAKVGGLDQARAHLGRYVELDGGSSWAAVARDYLGQLAN